MSIDDSAVIIPGSQICSYRPDERQKSQIHLKPFAKKI